MLTVKKTPLLVLKESARRRRPRPRRQRSRNSEADTFVRKYADTLMNPWEYGPLNLGYDCMVSTELLTAYRRETVQVVNAGDAVSIALFPDITKIVGIWQGAGSVLLTSALPASNVTSITNALTSARVVSGGVRVMALYPSTAAPGVIFSGSIPENNFSGVANVSQASLGAIQNVKMGFGLNGAAVTLRPQDNESYQFVQETILGYAGGTLMHQSIPFITLQGFPTGTIIWYEAVLNLEGPPKVFASASAFDQGVDQPKSASDYFASPQQLFNAVKGVVADPVIMDFAESVAAAAHPAAGAALRAVRHFGRGSHLKRVAESTRIQLIETPRPTETREEKTDRGRDEL